MNQHLITGKQAAKRLKLSDYMVRKLGEAGKIERVARGTGEKKKHYRYVSASVTAYKDSVKPKSTQVRKPVARALPPDVYVSSLGRGDDDIDVLQGLPSSEELRGRVDRILASAKPKSKQPKLVAISTRLASIEGKLNQLLAILS